MDALVVYKYRPAGAERGNEITIRYNEMDVDLNRFRTSPHMDGDTVTLQTEEEEEAIEMLGRDPKEYVVRERVHIITQVGDNNPDLTVFVIVTDPDS